MKASEFKVFFYPLPLLLERLLPRAFGRADEQTFPSLSRRRGLGCFVAVAGRDWPCGAAADFFFSLAGRHVVTTTTSPYSRFVGF